MVKRGSEEKEPYRRLAEINRAITTSLNFDEVLDLIVENAAQLVSARVSALLLVDQEGLLRIRSARGIDSKLIEEFAGNVDEDVIAQLRKSLKLDPSESLVPIPVIAKNVLRGLLVIVRDVQLDEEEEWQLSALADQAAIALRNARLYEMELAEATGERDRTLEALKESNQRISDILGSITDLFYYLDRDFRFRDVNRQTEIRYGKTRSDLMGKVIWEVYPAAVNSQLYPNFIKAMKDGEATHFEYASAIVPNTWFEAHVYPDDNGLSVYLRDISERKRAEAVNQRYAAIVESSEDAIVSKDLKGIIKSWNKGAERIFGYTQDEVIGKSVTILIPEDRFDEEPEILGNISAGRRVEHYETVRRRKDGTLINISITVSPIVNENGEIIGASKIARDISDREIVDKKIRFQASLLDAVEQAVIATDLDGTILYWNRFAESLYGWTPKETLGANVIDIIPTTATREEASEILTKLREGASWSGEFLARRKDGSSFPSLVTDSPIFDKFGELIGIVGVSIDITDRKNAEDERTRLLESERQARSEAEEANRLKDEFLATLSHELRNPLNVILGYAEVLLRSEEAKKSSFVSRAAEILKRNALAQSQLVRDLLDLSRLHMGKLTLNRETICLTGAIQNAVETVRDEANEKGVEIRIDMPDDMVFVDADSLRMEQIVWNLLNNAVKFTPPGGSVRLHLTTSGDQAQLVVTDTGQGIEAEFLPHVFEMFRQADATISRRHGGMGIGLALVQELVDLQDGSVSVYSAGQGHGAQFTIKMPLSQTKGAAKTMGRLVEPGALSRMRILVVDDSADTVDMLRHLFEMDGAAVKTASGGKEALEIAAKETFDVILSDISMPGMDGFEFLKRLRRLPDCQEVPVLALTGFGRVEDVERAKAEGFFSHVTKPVDVGNIVEILQKLPARAGS
jgi:PAS domain S-box-containing protein